MYTNNILRILKTGGLGQGLLIFCWGVVSGCRLSCETTFSSS